MIYTETYNTRWHDTDANRLLHPTALLVYMQETANRQFERLATPLDTIRDRDGLAFILSRIAIEIEQPLHAYEDIEVQTFTCRARGPIFPRGFLVLRDGEVVVRAMSQWALLRLADRSFARADDIDISFGDEEELALDQPLRLRIPREATFEKVGEREIVWSDVDYNMHMNNTKYPDMVCDFLPFPQSTRIVGMSLSYCREARLGDVLTVERADAGEGIYYFRTKCGEVTCLEAQVRTETL
ncbi:MAG: hypothetical protein IJW22_03230 [Clostridia bacterium]|nr:hypothetical protein [Clostridia bacterium]